MSNSLELYRQTPLKDSEIRLLCLKRTSNGAIEGSFRTESVHIAPPFIALSYTWGELTPKKTIYLEEELFSISQNLWFALMRILDHWSEYKTAKESVWLFKIPFYRTPQVKKVANVFDAFDSVCGSNANAGLLPPLWIDQICIDQDNIDERNAQVHAMKWIYVKASLVLAWLGENELAASGVRRIREVEGSIAPHQPPILSREVENEFRSLYQRPYWERLWVVQELALASKVLLLCGREALVFTRFASYIKCLNFVRSERNLISSRNKWDRMYFESQQQAEVKRNASTLLHVIDAVANPLDKHRSIPLHKLLELCEFQKCSDARDKIFGLLSLCPDCSIQADYSMSIPQIYTLCLKDYAKLKEYANMTEENQVIELDNVASLFRRVLNMDDHEWFPSTLEPDIHISRSRNALKLRVNEITDIKVPAFVETNSETYWITYYKTFFASSWGRRWTRNFPPSIQFQDFLPVTLLSTIEFVHFLRHGARFSEDSCMTDLKLSPENIPKFMNVVNCEISPRDASAMSLSAFSDLVWSLALNLTLASTELGILIELVDRELSLRGISCLDVVESMIEYTYCPDTENPSSDQIQIRLVPANVLHKMELWNDKLRLACING